MGDDKRPLTGQSGVNLMIKMPRDGRGDSMNEATRAAGAEIAAQKKKDRRDSYQQELLAEIDKARGALEKLETRARNGDTTPSLSSQIAKTRERLRQMELALEQQRAADASD